MDVHKKRHSLTTIPVYHFNGDLLNETVIKNTGYGSVTKYKILQLIFKNCNSITGVYYRIEYGGWGGLPLVGSHYLFTLKGCANEI